MKPSLVVLILSFLFSTTLFGQNNNLVGIQFAPEKPEVALERLKTMAAGFSTEIVDRAATQQGGRLKPFQTLARESLLYINGRYGRWGLTPSQLYLALVSSPSSPWVQIVEIRNPEVRIDLGFLKTQRFASLAELESAGLEDRVGPLFNKQKENSKSLTETEKATLELYNQMSLLSSVVLGEHLLGAMDFSRLNQDSETSTLQNTREKIQAYVSTLSQVEGPQRAETAEALSQWTRSQKVPALFTHSLGKLDLEILFNNLQIFFWAAILYVFFGCLLLVPEVRHRFSRKSVVLIFTIPIFLQILGLAMRVAITQFAPITNMYGTMIWVSLGVNLFSLILYGLYGNAVVSGAMLLVSGILLFLTHNFPLVLSPDMDPIVAVLRSNFWLSTHVTTITISYAALTIAMVLGNITLVRLLLKPNETSFLKDYGRQAYRMVQLGTFLLTVGIILGGVWADYSWGRFWGWDPKETWSLIANLAFLAILHARLVGWAPEFVFLALCPVAYLTVVMAWYGVNFILASGLHSYGFSSGGALAVAIFVAVQLGLLALAFIRRTPAPQSHE